MTPEDLLRAGACTSRCMLATTDPSRCKCHCGGAWHRGLLTVDIWAVAEARRAGLHHLSDLEIIGGTV